MDVVTSESIHVNQNLRDLYNLSSYKLDDLEMATVFIPELHAHVLHMKENFNQHCTMIERLSKALDWLLVSNVQDEVDLVELVKHLQEEADANFIECCDTADAIQKEEQRMAATVLFGKKQDTYDPSSLHGSSPNY